MSVITARPYSKGNKGWEVEFMYHLPSGNTLRLRKQARGDDGKLFASEKDALRWGRINDEHFKNAYLLRREQESAARKQKEVDQAKLEASGGEVPLFEVFANGFYDRKEAAKGDDAFKHSYLRSTESILRMHLVPFFGDKRLDRITSGDIDDFRLLLGNQSKSGNTINNILTMLAMIFSEAKRRHPKFEPPNIKRVKKRKRLVAEDEDGQDKILPDGVRCYTEEQLTKLLQAQNDTVLRALVAVGGTAGLRAGEIAGLKWSDIGEADLVVRRSIVEGNIGKPKNGYMRRVPINKTLRSALAALSKGSEYIFHSDGKYLSYRSQRTLMEHAQAAAGFEARGNLHVLRHSFCSIMALRGTPLSVVQELAGHANIETTQRYVHSDRAKEKVAVSAFDQLGEALERAA